MTVEGRVGTDADALDGVRPETVYEPSSVEEAVAAVSQSSSARRSLVFVGGATELDLGARPDRIDDMLSTRKLDRVIEHAPSDQIVVVEAGVPLARLQELLARSGQRLALDPPLAQRATIGGIVATNRFGPRRARFGSIRDLIIGVSIVRADGTLARAGSKVVKNVAGFDLPKLMVGSLGTLGLIATVTLRLHPLPQEETTMLLPEQSSRHVREIAAALRREQLEPTSVVAVWQGGDRFEVAVRFEGFRAGVVEQQERLASLGASGGRGSWRTLDDGQARAFWAQHDELRGAAPLRAKLATLPTDLEAIASAALPRLADAFRAPGFLWYATLGLGFFSGTPEDLAAGSEALTAARGLLEARGGHVTLVGAPASIRARVGVWGRPAPSVSLMARVKDRLDPDHRLAPGRFVGGI